jgi:hypothetical protein
MVVQLHLVQTGQMEVVQAVAVVLLIQEQKVAMVVQV